jgi:hypothetical protein
VDGGSAGQGLLTYDLTQDAFSLGGYQLGSADRIEAPATISGIALDNASNGGGGSTAVPEPSTYALAMIGVLALAAIRGRRLRIAAQRPQVAQTA